MSTILIVIYVLSAVCLIGVILMQRSKSDMGTDFGSGSSNSMFGSSGAGDFLSRLTAVIAFVFFVTALIIARTQNTDDKDIYDNPSQQVSEKDSAVEGKNEIPE